MRRLVTIPISHYCEKARWALERAGLDYAEERHVQGIHQLAARRAGGGITVPVLVADDGVYPESEEILRYADRHLDPELRLFPDEAGLRAEVEALSRRLDEGLGPDGRRLIYVHMLDAKDEMLRYNNQGVPRWESRTLRLLWSPLTRYVRRRLALGPDTLRDDERRVRAAFDAVAQRLADGRPHLCGERFTAADLTFACLASPVISPPEYGITLPQPDEMPAPLAATVRAFRDHPAGAYALALFRDHRRAKATRA